MPTFTYFVPLSLDIDARRDPGISVSSQLNPGGNRASLKINDRPALSPFVITDPVTARTMFKGSVSSFTDEYEEDPLNDVHAITGIDASWTFNKYRPFGKYTNQSLSNIVIDLVGRYATDFTTIHVQTGLPSISITFTGEETLDQAITRAVQVAGDCRWYKDYNQDVHVFHVVPPSLPDLSVPLRPGPANPLVPSQTANLIVGPSGPGSGSFGPGVFLVAYSWEYDDGKVSAYSPWAVVGWDGTHKQQIASIAVGSAYLGHNVVARRVWLAYFTEFNGYDSRNFVAFSYFRVADNATTSVEANFGGLGQMVAGVYTTFGTYSFFPTIGPTVKQPLVAPTGPVAAPTIATGGIVASFTYTPGKYVFGYSFVYADGQESLMSPVSAVYTADGSHVPAVTIGVGSPRVDGTIVIARKIYWAYDAVNTPVFDAAHYYGGGHAIVPDNTTTAFSWATYAIGTLSGIWTGFEGQPVAIQGTPGPNPEDTDGENPSTITDLSPTLLKDPPFKVTYDKSQIRNRVFVRGASVSAIAPAAIGATTVSIPTGHPFKGTGGLAFVGTRVYRYDATTSTSIHLTTPLTETIAVGDIVGIWTQQDDTEAQNWLAEQEDGDGVHEFTVVDTSLATVQDIERRALAELALFARPIITAEYATRDPKHFPGRLVTFDMTNPPLSATLLIQSVTVDQIDETTDNTLAPRFRVKASSTRFTLDDLFRNVALLGSASGVGSTGISGSGGTGGSGGGSSSLPIFGEVPTGAVNGSNAVFTTAHGYFRGTLRVYVNGIRQTPANVTETSATTFTLGTAPTTGDELVCDYTY
jgi:hypothetical protein